MRTYLEEDGNCCLIACKYVTKLTEKPFTLEKVFLADLVVAATRVWEAFSKNADGNGANIWLSIYPCDRSSAGSDCFEYWTSREQSILRMIKHDCNRIFLAFDGGVEISRLESHSVISAAMTEIRANKTTVDEIESLSDSELNNYLASIKVYTFKSVSRRGIDHVLDALSSMDGTRSYLERSCLDDPDQSTPRILLEHELMHNISRWNKNDPLKISPKKNRNLVIGDRMVEAGDFYQHRVYKHVISDPCPFGLSEFQRNSY